MEIKINSEKEKDFIRNNKEHLLISVVIPMFNEEGSLPELIKLLEDNLTIEAGDKYEILFIDDGSTDSSLELLKKYRKINPKIKVISFRRNYGKSAALAVGFDRAEGDIIITMDSDLQDDPSEIKNLVKKINEGYDLVSGWKKTRHDPINKTLPSKFFNFVTSLSAGIKLHDFNCGLKAYRKDAAKSLEVYGEMHRYLPALSHWDGFRVTEIPVLHHARKYGKTKFGASRYLKGFLDLLTILFTTRYFKRPLHFFGAFGVLFTCIGFGINLYLSIEWFLNKTYLSDKPLLLLGIALIIVGVQFISTGLIGEMLAKQNNKDINYNIKEELV